MRNKKAEESSVGVETLELVVEENSVVVEKMEKFVVLVSEMTMEESTMMIVTEKVEPLRVKH